MKIHWILYFVLVVFWTGCISTAPKAYVNISGEKIAKPGLIEIKPGKDMYLLEALTLSGYPLSEPQNNSFGSYDQLIIKRLNANQIFFIRIDKIRPNDVKLENGDQIIIEKWNRW